MKGYYSLNMMRFNITKSTSGFTLIELLVVIAMISILAGALFMVINPAQLQRKSREAVLKARTSQVCTALGACGAVKTGATDCYATSTTDFSKLNIPNPSGDPVGSSYQLTCSASPCLSGSMLVVNGTLGTCGYTCYFNFSDGSVGNLATTGTCL